MTTPLDPAKKNSVVLAEGRSIKSWATLFALLMLISSMCAYAQAPARPPIPVQIASAKTAFLSNSGDADAKTLTVGYNAVYSALQSWGRYQLTSTPADADLILELRFAHILGSSVSYNEQDTMSLHILDRSTRTVLWSITVNENDGSNAKFAARAANDILNELKSLVQTNPSANVSAPTKTRFSDEGKK